MRHSNMVPKLTTRGSRSNPLKVDTNNLSYGLNNYIWFYDYFSDHFLLLPELVHFLSPWHRRHGSITSNTQESRTITKIHRFFVVFVHLGLIRPVQLWVPDHKASSKAVTSSHRVDDLVIFQDIWVQHSDWFSFDGSFSCDDSCSFTAQFEQNLQSGMLDQ